MFTGIIQKLGKVQFLKGSRLEIKAKLGQIKKGDSISVNGVCLTAVSIKKRSSKKLFQFDIAEETFKKTNFGNLQKGGMVNLEVAARMGDFIGGHIVQGHVDGTGKVLSKTSEKSSILYRFSIEKNLQRYLITKGSITIDGISLTVVDVFQKAFTVAIIPHTEKNTVLGHRKIGDSVNLEVDMMAKYIHNFLQHQKKRRS